MQTHLSGPTAEAEPPLFLKRPDRQYGAEQEAVVRARNGLQAEAGALVAENRSRRVSFGPDGVNFELKLFDDPTDSATVKGAPPRARLSLGFELTDIRLGSTSLVKGQPDPIAGGNWVRYSAADQGWQVVYEVGDGLVEQYFVLEAPPSEQGDLVIEGRFQTNLQPVYLADDAGIRFEAPGQADRPEVALGYGPAVVEDARGRRLTAQMELKDKTLRLTIPAAWLAEADFPLVVDPVIGSAELISTLQGAAHEPRLASDGTDFLAVWDWNGDIYGQRLDSDGDHVGDLITISQAEDGQQQAEVVYNPVSDEYLVTWVDRRYGYEYRTLYSRRVDLANGALLGSEVEVMPPSSYLGYFGGVRVAVSEAGDYLLVWTHSGSGTNYDLFGHLMTAGGVLTGSLIELSGAVADAQIYPGVAYDDQADTFLVSWADRRDGSGYDLYGQRLDDQGALIGSNQLLVDAGGQDVEKTVVAATDTDQFLVVWAHELSGSDTDILGLRMTASTGSVLSGTIEIDTGSGNDAAPAVVPLSTSAYLVVWAEDGYKLSTRRVGSDGSLPGTPLLDFARGYVPAVAFDGSQALTVWEDYLTAGQKLVTGQRLSTGDSTIGDLIYVSPYYSARSHTSLAYQAASGTYLAAWDQAAGGPGPDIFIQELDDQGRPAGSALNVTEQPETSQQKPSLAAGANSFLVVWEDERNSGTNETDLYAHLLDQSGHLSGTELSLAQTTGAQVVPHTVYNSQRDEYLVAWEDYRNGGSDGEIYYQRVEPDGSLSLSPPGRLVITNTQGHPQLAYNPALDHYLVVFHDARPGSNGVDLYGQVISADGSLTGSSFEVTGASGNQYISTVDYNPAAGVFLVAWEDQRHGGSNPDLYGQVISGSGTSLLGSEVELATAGQPQSRPALAARSGDATAEFVLVWQDQRNGWFWDIYMQRLNGAGQLLDETDPTVNVPLALDSSVHLEQPAIVYNPANQVYLMAWSNRADGGVYIQRYASSTPPAPTAGFTAQPTVGPLPLTVVFSDTSTGQIGQHTWQFGDGGVSYSTGSQVEHTYETTGTFTTVLTVSNPGGASSASQVITVTEQITPYLNEDFESYEPASEPPFWLNQKSNLTPRDDFEIKVVDGSRVYGSTSSGIPSSYSTYAIPGWAAWQDYDYSGRLQLENDGGLAVVVYSRFPANVAKSYRLLRDSGQSLRLSAAGSSLSGTVDTGVTPQLDTWYRFRVQVRTDPDQVKLRARVWLDGTTEPATWQAEAEDATANRTTAGAVGVRGYQAVVSFDDLVVTPLGLQADFSAATRSGPAPFEVTLVAEPFGQVLTYTWDFGDGSGPQTTLVPTATYTYATPGVFSVTLTVERPAGSGSLTKPNYIAVTSSITRNWQVITTTNAPPVSGEHGMAYNDDRDVVVLYGGNATGWPYETTTWELTGTTWLTTTDQGPPARYGAQMAYLPPVNGGTEGGLFLFGGSDETDTAFNQTWTYTNSTWSQVTITGTVPASRTYHSMASNPISGTIYLFGGNPSTSSGQGDGAQAYFNDLWKYENGAWTEIAVSGTLPVSRTLAALTYDPDQNRLLLFGGRSLTGTLLADLWAIDPTAPSPSWTKLDGGGGGGPPARMAH